VTRRRERSALFDVSGIARIMALVTSTTSSSCSPPRLGIVRAREVEMSEAKGYVCISASGAVVGGCVVLDRARARHVMRAWLRSHPGCRVKSVAVEQTYLSLRSAPRRRRPSATHGTDAAAHAADHR
jgi:hypothetical protein